MQPLQSLFVVFVLLLSWLLMQVIHEAGHVIAAWATGGNVARVVLHPLRISRTDVDPNPQPWRVAWGGPLFGVLAPLIAWAVAERARASFAWLLRFFAGFCLLANGLYLGVGSFPRIGDAGDLRQYGSPMWHLWLFGIVSTIVGLVLWNGLGPNFGLGPRRLPIDRHLAIVCVGLLMLIAIAEIVWSSLK